MERGGQSFEKEESYQWTQVQQGSKGQELRFIPHNWQLVVDHGKQFQESGRGSNAVDCGMNGK